MKKPRISKLGWSGFFIAGLLAGCGTQEQQPQESPGVVSSALTGGGLDLDAYCKLAHGHKAYVALRNWEDPNSWFCQASQYQIPVDFSTACLQQYGAGSTPAVSDPHNAFTWYCSAPQVGHCDAPDGSEYLAISSVKPAGISGSAGYEVFGEASPWEVHIKTNPFSTDSSAHLLIPVSLDGQNEFDAALWGRDAVVGVAVPKITPSSPSSHQLLVKGPCSTLSYQTPPLTRVYPDAAPVPGLTASSTYINSGAPVALTLTRASVTPTSCIGNSAVVVEGKQPYDGKVVLNTAYPSNIYSTTINVKPILTTTYTATWYCVQNPSIRSVAKITVAVYGGPLPCSDGSYPKPYTFCRDCPYNTPPLTTLVYSACSSDEALRLAEGDSFGGSCNISDGECSSCTNPSDCSPE